MSTIVDGNTDVLAEFPSLTASKPRWADQIQDSTGVSKSGRPYVLWNGKNLLSEPNAGYLTMVAEIDPETGHVTTEPVSAGVYIDEYAFVPSSENLRRLASELTHLAVALDEANA